MNLQSRRLGERGLAKITGDESLREKLHRGGHVQQVETSNTQAVAMAFGQALGAGASCIPGHGCGKKTSRGNGTLHAPQRLRFIPQRTSLGGGNRAVDAMKVRKRSALVASTSWKAVNTKLGRPSLR